MDGNVIHSNGNVDDGILSWKMLFSLIWFNIIVDVHIGYSSLFFFLFPLWWMFDEWSVMEFHGIVISWIWKEVSQQVERKKKRNQFGNAHAFHHEFEYNLFTMLKYSNGNRVEKESKSAYTTSNFFFQEFNLWSFSAKMKKK